MNRAEKVVMKFRSVFVFFLLLLLASITVIEAARAEQPSVDQSVLLATLGPLDQVSIWAYEVEELSNKTFRIDADGFLDLPLVGRVKAAGRTTEQLRGDLDKLYRAHVKEPAVSVRLVEVGSKPVSIVGAVTNPGVHQIQGRKTLLEVLSQAGGLRPDAGSTIRVTRDAKWGKVPIAGATEDAAAHVSVAEINLRPLLDGKTPEANIQVLPSDVISIPKTDIFYVYGDVRKPGAFQFGERKGVTILQALSQAEGALNTASMGNARILRLLPDSNQRQDIPVNIKKLIAGGSTEMVLQPDDILLVPSNTGKKIMIRTIEAGIGVGTGVVIWRR